MNENIILHDHEWKFRDRLLSFQTAQVAILNFSTLLRITFTRFGTFSFKISQTPRQAILMPVTTKKV